MSDGFDPSPLAPLPTEGEFRTEYDSRAWWGSKGFFFAIPTAIFLGLPAYQALRSNWNGRDVKFLLVSAAVFAVIWAALLWYRAVRSKREAIVIDWAAKKVTCSNMRTREADLLNPGEAGVTIPFEDLRHAEIVSNYRAPNTLTIHGTTCTIVAGLHFDDPEGLVARIQRIARGNPKQTFAERIKRLALGPIALLLILLAFIAFFVTLLVMLNP